MYLHTCPWLRVPTLLQVPAQVSPSGEVIKANSRIPRKMNIARGHSKAQPVFPEETPREPFESLKSYWILGLRRRTTAESAAAMHLPGIFRDSMLLKNSIALSNSILFMEDVLHQLGLNLKISHAPKLLHTCNINYGSLYTKVMQDFLVSAVPINPGDCNSRTS